MPTTALGAGAHSLTLMDWAKRLDPKGRVDKIVELLAETNEVLQDAMWVEGNLPTGHRTTVRSDLPSATWRKLNYGVAPSKSKTTQVTDTIGMLETYSEIDKKLAQLNGNTAAFRLSEDRPFLEKMNQDLASTIFYGDTGTYPERFLGLAPRYASLGTPSGKPTANNYMKQVINHGGSSSGSMTSIWLVCWGPNTCHMIFSKGSKAGIEHQDLGEVTLYDGAGGRYQGYRSHFKLEAGLVVRDWRYVVRIANVVPTSTIDYKTLIRAINTIPTLGMGKCAFYCTRSVKAELEIAAAEKTNAALTLKEVHGKPITSFWNIPIRQTDALLETEATVS